MDYWTVCIFGPNLSRVCTNLPNLKPLDLPIQLDISYKAEESNFRELDLKDQIVLHVLCCWVKYHDGVINKGNNTAGKT